MDWRERLNKRKRWLRRREKIASQLVHHILGPIKGAPETCCGIKGVLFGQGVLILGERQVVFATKIPVEVTCVACMNAVYDAIGYKGPRYGASIIRRPKQSGSKAASARPKVRA
jgi:hypothetical protein